MRSSVISPGTLDSLSGESHFSRKFYSMAKDNNERLHRLEQRVEQLETPPKTEEKKSFWSKVGDVLKTAVKVILPILSLVPTTIIAVSRYKDADTKRKDSDDDSVKFLKNKKRRDKHGKNKRRRPKIRGWNDGYMAA